MIFLCFDFYAELRELLFPPNDSQPLSGFSEILATQCDSARFLEIFVENFFSTTGIDIVALSCDLKAEIFLFGF